MVSFLDAGLVELLDTPDLESGSARSEGSTPLAGTWTLGGGYVGNVSLILHR
jgi:hypothetical protein